MYIKGQTQVNPLDMSKMTGGSIKLIRIHLRPIYSKNMLMENIVYNSHLCEVPRRLVR